MIFKTFDSDIDKISAKWGIFGKSFNDIGTAINGKVAEINKNFQITDDLIGSIKNSGDSIWRRLYPSKESIQSKMIDVDTLYPEKTDAQFATLLNNLQQQQKLIDATKGSWSDYFKEFQEGEKWQIKFVQNTDLQKASLDDVKGAYEGAKQGAIAHNEAIKATTLSAKVGKIALQGLAMAGNMIAMWTISKGIELLVTSIDNWVHSAERATESLEETTSALADTSNEIENLETQVSDLGNKIAELQALSDAGTISIADEKQLELLKEENKELLTNIALLEDKQRKEAENAVKALGDNKNDYTYQYLDDTPTTTYADSGIPITNTASHWEFVKTSATEALEKYIQTYQDWKDTAQAENNQGYMDEALKGVNATIEAYKELEKTEAGLDATQQAEYDNALRVQQLYLEHIYAINGTESAYRALNQETQKKILNDRLIAQLGEDNQDYVNAILSAIDPEQYADLWDKDFSFTPPQMTDYVTA